MDPQVASIRRFVVWAVLWALALTLVAGLFLWKSPMRAAGDALPPTPASLSIPAVVATGTLEPTSGPVDQVYFPLLFNRSDPFLPAAAP